MKKFRIKSIVTHLLVFTLSTTICGAKILITAGSDVQAVIDAHPPGTKYQLSSGVYRGDEIVPKDGDTLVGIGEVVISGAELLTGWEQEGDLWLHRGPHAKVVENYDADNPFVQELRARYPHDLFVDDLPIRQVFSTSAISDEAKWYYDYDNDIVYIRFDPAGKVLELSGLCRWGLKTNASNVTLQNLRFEKYATTNQKGAVELGPSATVENCVVYGSHSVGIKISGGSIVRNSKFCWNGNAGFQNGGNSTLIELNEFAYNGWAGYNGAWSRAGIKVAAISNSIIRKNYVHHTTGPGIWFDVNANHNVCEQNISEYNTWEGILVEFSCQNIIRQNICRWNGLEPRGGFLWGVPIIVQNSEDTEVYDNYLECSTAQFARNGGISVISQNRNDHANGPCGTHIAENNHIHDNVILTLEGGSSGVGYGTLGWDRYEDFLASNNVWEGNTYYTSNPHALRFEWFFPDLEDGEGLSIKRLTWGEWRNIGQESLGTVVGKPPSFFKSHESGTNSPHHKYHWGRLCLTQSQLQLPRGSDN